MAMEGKENTAQKVEQKNEHLEKTLSTINGILAERGDSNKVEKIDDVLSREFVKNSESIANDILKEISKLPPETQNDPEVQKIINAFKIKTVSGNDEGQTYRNKTEAKNTNDNMDPLNTIISLPTYKNDIKNINKSILDCQKYTQGAENYKNLHNNLNAINKILSKDTTTYRDLKQIDAFLKKNNIETGNWNQNNIAPLLEGVKKFLEQVQITLKNNQEGDKVINEHQEKIVKEEQQKQEEIARKQQEDIERNATEAYQRKIKLKAESDAFDKIFYKIPNDIGNLSTLTEGDIAGIKGFINDSINEAQIGRHQNPKEDVLNLYFLMRTNKQYINVGKDINKNKITSYDSKNFNQIFQYIEEAYKQNGKNEIAEHELSTIITIDNLKEKAPENWKGKDLTNDDDKFINENYGGRSFTAQEFKEKFNSLNKQRKEKNEASLKKEVDIKDLTKDLLGKITIEENGEGEQKTEKLIFTKDDGSTEELKADNFIETLGLKIETNNIDFLGDGDEKQEAIRALQGDRFNELKKLRKEYTPQKPEIKLEEITVEDIKNNLRDGVIAKNVINFYNEAKSKSDLTDAQKNLLKLTQEGLTHENKINDKIKDLQKALGFEGKDIDGKFGKTTFNALLKTFNIENINTPTNKNIDTPTNKNVDTPTNRNKIEWKNEDNKQIGYIKDLKQLLTFKIPEGKALKYKLDNQNWFRFEPNGDCFFVYKKGRNTTYPGKYVIEGDKIYIKYATGEWLPDNNNKVDLIQRSKQQQEILRKQHKNAKSTADKKSSEESDKINELYNNNGALIDKLGLIPTMSSKSQEAIKNLGIDGTKTLFKKEGNTGIYYFDDNNTLHYIPDLSQEGKYHYDKVALGQKYIKNNDKRQWYWETLQNNTFTEYLNKGLAELINDNKGYEGYVIATIKGKDGYYVGNPHDKKYIQLTSEILSMFEKPKDCIYCAISRLRYLYDDDPSYKNSPVTRNEKECSFGRFSSTMNNQDKFKSCFKPSIIPNKGNREKLIKYLSKTSFEDVVTIGKK